MCFYLKLTEEEANSIIINGINQLFGGTPSKFDQYTYFIEDTGTGEKYWRVEDYDGYPIKDWIKATCPELTRYTHDFVSQFLPKHEV